MTNNDIKVPAVTGKAGGAVAALKITRNDLIELVVKDVRERHHKAIRDKQAEVEAATMKYIDGVNEAANRRAKPAVEALAKVASGMDGTLRANYTYRLYSRGKHDDIEALPDNVQVPIADFGGRYSSTVFKVEVRLTKPLRQLRQRVHDLYDEVARLRNTDTTLTGMRGIVRQKVLHQSVMNTPEGQDVLAALRALTEQVEATTGKPILARD